MTSARYISGAKADCGNVCSNPFCQCNGQAGWTAWCDRKWDHHCCFKEGPPSTEVCVEVETCRYVCCSWPQKPCGLKCCDPATGLVIEKVQNVTITSEISSKAETPEITCQLYDNNKCVAVGCDLHCQFIGKSSGYCSLSGDYCTCVCV